MLLKCDENKPCGNCARHGVLCSLIDPTVPPPVPALKREPSAASLNRRKLEAEQARKDSASTIPASLPIDYVLNPSPAAAKGASEGASPEADPFPYLSKFANRSDAIQPNYWVRDLELMHHWVTQAYKTITPRPEFAAIWISYTPKTAVLHHHLMHELLAFSALHMAYLQTDQTRPFYGLGIHHQDLAIRSLRKVLPNMSPDNAGALALTSALLVLTVFASRGMDAVGKPPGPVIEDLMDVFELIQGILKILMTGAASVFQGPFAAFMSGAPVHTPSPAVFSHIETHIDYLSNLITARPDMSVGEKAEVAGVLMGFRTILGMYCVPHKDSKELRFLFALTLSFSPEFLEKLKARQAPAMAIMSVYAVALRAAENEFWFMQGWAERLMRAIGEVVDETWQGAVKWPWEYVVIEAEMCRMQANVALD
ncbi:hypothetical protein B0J11DRAFT_26059 [Dendryphion nanum]|uniref:Zn(2)-C6 fungal-type domain-containing protein n=1 Tax=Dendryphion nanum TaxID=256645 RepID=A0A9P9EKQ7_9PLEO|nr:hypothetical protein B0J11DRAFT_26059 [Dendryphion nanum]